MIGTHVGSFMITCALAESDAGGVYLAEHPMLRTRRTVKVLSPRLTQNALAVRRFINDARAAARLSHRNVIRLHDIGQLASGEWFAMLDDCEGRTLGRLMAGRTGPMLPELVLHIVSEIANGLQAAHNHHVVHREITPDGVLVTARDRDPYHVVLRDFGIARLDDDPVEAHAYLAPEQLCGGAFSPAVDVFALGVIAYQMSTGGWFPHQYGESRTGYEELSRDELYHRQISGPPVDPRERAPTLSAGWTDVLLAAVSAEPGRRPASVRALALGLAEALPRTDSSTGGLAIVRACAPELLDGAALQATAALHPVESRPDVGSESGARYQLGDQLGAGGMAEVFSATMVGAEGFTRRVAVKRVLPGLSQDPAFAAMFVAEARIASRLAHPNIVSVLDLARDAEDRLHLVMEYVDGKDLASLLTAGPIAPSLAIFVTIEVLRALGYAHELPDRPDRPDRPDDVRGIVHRDVSPQNLLLGYQGAVKLSDFGLAKVRAASGVVRSDSVRGKPSYMSPEQVLGQPLDGRSDLFAVGVMLWEMLAHRPLFAGTAREITAQVMFKDIARPSRFRGEVPGDLEAIAMRLLAYAREDRYPTAAAVVEALLACGDASRDGRGELVQLLAARFRAPASGGRGPRAGQITRTAPVGVPAASPVRAWPARPRRGRLTATRLLLVLGGVAAVVLVRGEIAPSRTPERGAPAAFAASESSVAPRRAASAASTLSAAPAAPPASFLSPVSPGSVALPGSVDAGIPEPRPPIAHPADSGPARPAPPHHERIAAAGRTGELAIIVRPWAMIWLNGKPSGQTPFRSAVPAGRYRVRLANDDAGRDETMTVVVEPDQTATVERSW